MRVTFLLDRLNLGGAERQTCAVTRALASRGHLASLLVLEGEASANFPADIVPDSTHFLGLSNGLTPSGFRKLGQAILTSGVEVVAAVNQTALVTAVVSRLLGYHKAKIVCVFHTTIISNLVGILKLPAFYMSLRLSDGIIYVSENQKRYWDRRRLAAPISKSIVNGVDPDLFCPPSKTERSNARLKLGVNDDELIVAICARFSAEKNHQQLLRAAQMLVAENRKIRLLLVGGGALRLELETLTESLGLSRSVIFAGEHRSVRSFLAAADVFVLCSNAIETFSMAALEAMAMGLPVVLSNIGGASEMVESGVDGYLFPVDDTLALAQRLRDLFNRNVRLSLGAEATLKVRMSFTAERMVDQYEATFAHLIHPTKVNDRAPLNLDGGMVG